MGQGRFPGEFRGANLETGIWNKFDGKRCRCMKDMCKLVIFRKAAGRATFEKETAKVRLYLPMYIEVKNNMRKGPLSHAIHSSAKFLQRFKMVLIAVQFFSPCPSSAAKRESEIRFAKDGCFAGAWLKTVVKRRQFCDRVVFSNMVLSRWYKICAHLA